MANTPGGGEIIVGVEDRSGRLLGAAMDEDVWTLTWEAVIRGPGSGRSAHFVGPALG